MWDSLSGNTCATCFSLRARRYEAVMDKENMQSPSKIDDLSLYETNSAIVPMCSSPSHCTHNIVRRPLEDHDSNSQDSGYSASFQSDNNKFTSYASPSRCSFGSFGSNSMGSMEDDYLEDFSDVEPLDKHPLPEGFDKLIVGPLINKPKIQENKQDLCIRPQFRRALSLHNPPSDRITPQSSRIRSCLFKSGDELRPFKRPEPPSEGQVLAKRSKIFEDDDEASVPEVPTRPVLKRAFSATEESIMSAVQRSSDTHDLIGDFSKEFCLPLTNGRHQDLRAINAQTLASLIRGEFDHSVASFKIIDCRYPYEFEGGHINGAINIYTKEHCLELLNQHAAALQQPNKRHILVFHCEFSSERGPNLYRYLRKEDRHKNEQDYPSLSYPEVYLLEGGYKSFFQSFSEMCIPVAYKEMLHPEHEDDLRRFRQKSKTWNSDSRQRPQINRRRFGRLDV